MSKLLLFALLIGYAACYTFYIEGIVHDQAPSSMKLCGSAGTANGSYGFTGTDFQLPVGSYHLGEKGIAGVECNKDNNFTNCGTIGPDRYPVYAYSGRSAGGSVMSGESFYNWFHETPQTVKVPVSLQFNSATNNRVATFSNSSFFPIDGQGWNDSCPDANRKNHNFGFCFDAHWRVNYMGGEAFGVTTSDSVFLYINNLLVIDLGGVHSIETKVVHFDDLPGLVKGESYRVDFFYCERHTSDSVLQIQTTIENAACSYYDWCGVCEGNGQSCCSKETCNDNNACTVDSCAMVSGRPTCVFTPINCNDNNSCTVDSCKQMNGTASCLHTPYECNDHNACTVDWCAPVEGKPMCSYKAIECNDNNNCTMDSCSGNVGCQFRPINSTSCRV